MCAIIPLPEEKALHQCIWLYYSAVSSLGCSTRYLHCVTQHRYRFGGWTLVVAGGPVVTAWRLGCSVVCAMLVPRPGIKSMSLALQARF